MELLWVQVLALPFWTKSLNSLGFKFLLNKVETAILPHRVLAGFNEILYVKHIASTWHL